MKLRLQHRQNRIAAAFVGQRDLTPAKFRRGAQMVLAAISPCHQLRAKADTQHRLVSLPHAPHQARQFGQVGVGIVGQRVLFATQHHQRIMIGPVRQSFARPGAKYLNFRVRLAQGGAHLSKRGHFGIVDHRNAHACPHFCLTARMTMPARQGQEPACGFALANP